MILILSNGFDFSTSEVIDWLYHYGVEFLRINEGEKVLVDSIYISNNSDFIFHLDGCRYSTKDFTSYWYRRGYFQVGFNSIDESDSEELSKLLISYHNSEINTLNSFLIDKIESRFPALGNFQSSDVHKLKVLDKANAYGLLIPPTTITCNKEVVVNFVREHGDTISKPIKEALILNRPEYTLVTYTSLIDLTNLPNVFFPSLIQKRIEKKYELRIFFLDGQFFAMAIFSQLDVQTQIDFRNYNKTKPNRTVPFEIPPALAAKLRQLLEDLALNTASIDMIVDRDQNYYFLEVNPIGQFGMVSYPCNYSLENRIAKFLINRND